MAPQVRPLSRHPVRDQGPALHPRLDALGLARRRRRRDPRGGRRLRRDRAARQRQRREPCDARRFRQYVEIR
ncbi:hypothetical protein F8O04_06590 [Pseudoclavibacter endophyticus]|uniref:Uncharacterized protein n=1 Tax=Pseudoclavibacter endophyticus TaxID=1778590 RepID=A0A6H9WSI4_9MICO|nr:hypothetical protein F8O04_06590 [Pseudoclavibacter endophyticus]